MKILKKLFLILLIATATLTLASCGETEDVEIQLDDIPEEAYDELVQQVEEARRSGTEAADGSIRYFTYDAVYLGIQGYGEIDRVDVLDPECALYRFTVDGKEQCYKIDCGEIFSTNVDADSDNDGKDDYLGVLSLDDNAYLIQNNLKVGYSYKIYVTGDTIIGVSETEKMDEIEAYCKEENYSFEAGSRTIKGLLQTALAPLGNVLYVYGGGWDFQDIGASTQARTIGINPDWVRFKNSQDENYLYRDENAKSETTYPFGGWNNYYYAGLDCSGYIGWTLYNTINRSSMTEQGMVTSAVKTAYKLANTYEYGTFEHEIGGGKTDESSLLTVAKSLLPGDIVSISGHVYLVIGMCSDGSVVIAHCNTTASNSGALGGGVMLSAINPNVGAAANTAGTEGANTAGTEGAAANTKNTDCEAYRLACKYSKLIDADWTQTYPVVMADASKYLCFPTDTEKAGIFHWDLAGKNKLTDPDGYIEKSAAEILADLFGE